MTGPTVRRPRVRQSVARDDRQAGPADQHRDA